jgi:TolB-like protein/Tfp pilus assembly protein PilF
MDLLSRIASWLSENEATISAVGGIAVLSGIVFAGVRSLVRRRGETSLDKAPGASAEPASAADSSAPELDPLNVPGFEGRPAIAVLAFDDLSSERDQEYFADGIAEDLLTRLSAWRWFPVIARNSSFAYRGKAVDVKRVGRELGVRYVVEGSVRKAGERVRITAQLIDATTGAHVWAETYDREMRDIFALQDEITEAIVASVAPELVRSEGERAARKEPQTLDAWDCLTRGLWHLHQSTKEDNLAARQQFERAIELDPHLAPAFASLANLHRMDLLFQWTDSPERSVGELVRAAERAVALDDRSAYAQAAVGTAYSLKGEQEKAIAALELAIELNPSAAMAYSSLGTALATAGMLDQGIAKIETAMRLGPKDPLMWLMLFGMAFTCFVAERYEEALDWARRSLQRRPDWAGSYRVLAASHAHLDQLEKAREALTESLRRQPDFSASTWRMTMSGVDPEVHDRYIDGLRKAGLPE